jgi:hypothetical protein
MVIKRLICSLISVAFFGTGMLMPVQAAMVGTQAYLQTSDRQANIAIVDAALLRSDVQQQLADLGVDVENARQRVAGLPDRDLARLAEEIESMPAGGTSLLAVVGIVFIVLLILEVTGVIDIFKGR